VLIGRRELLRLGRAALAYRLLLAAGGAAADALEEALAELEQRTREYRSTLERLVAMHETSLTRATAAAEQSRRLHAEGLVARRDAEEAERVATEAQARLDEARKQLADADGLMVEADALRRLAALPPVPPGAEQSTPEVVEYHGVSAWTLAQVSSLDRFFTARFGRPLPVSALGQTAVHDRLGFDHRNAADVAVHPDSVEGRTLLDHLRALGIPFLAFRGPVAGASTGAHVHVGAPSPRTG
jgi:multidrug efflux pump subunit AcrA (membrane-fusion protein)